MIVHYGFSDKLVSSSDAFGALDNKTFFHGGFNHRIYFILERRDGGTNTLRFTLRDNNFTTVSDLALHVGGKSFYFSDAATNFNPIRASQSLSIHLDGPRPELVPWRHGFLWRSSTTPARTLVRRHDGERERRAQGLRIHTLASHRRRPKATTIGAITDGDLEYDGATHIVTEVKNFRRTTATTCGSRPRQAKAAVWATFRT